MNKEKKKEKFLLTGGIWWGWGQDCLKLSLLKISTTKNTFKVIQLPNTSITGLQRHIKAHNNIYCKIDSLNLNKL